MSRNKLKPRGRPFAAGNDPRRHVSGEKSKAALSFRADMKRLIETQTDAEEIFQVLYAKAKAGVPWAVQELLDRGLGKAPQSIGLKDETPRDIRILWGRPPGPRVLASLDEGAKALPEHAGPPKGDVELRMPRPGWEVGQDEAEKAPETQDPASLTDAELEAEIARLEKEGGEHESAA